MGKVEFKSPADAYTLANGVTIPCLGFGTWQTPEGEVAVSSVLAALRAGYRHVDTAQAYGNEAGVGEGVRRSGLDRKDVFVTSKLWNADHGYERTRKAFEGTMARLGLEYLDLYLIHWPNPLPFRDCWQEANAGTWRAFEEFYREGRVRAIGVSNFRPHHVEALLKTAEVAPMVNQIRLCPGDTQDETVAYSRGKGMLLEAYSPLGVGKANEVPELQAVAAKYGKSVAQVCIRWSLQRGYLPLPKSVTPARIAENAQVFDFELDEEDVAAMAAVPGLSGYASDPDAATF